MSDPDPNTSPMSDTTEKNDLYSLLTNAQTMVILLNRSLYNKVLMGRMDNCNPETSKKKNHKLSGCFKDLQNRYKNINEYSGQLQDIINKIILIPSTIDITQYKGAIDIAKEQKVQLLNIIMKYELVKIDYKIDELEQKYYASNILEKQNDEKLEYPSHIVTELDELRMNAFKKYHRYETDQTQNILLEDVRKYYIEVVMKLYLLKNTIMGHYIEKIVKLKDKTQYQSEILEILNNILNFKRTLIQSWASSSAPLNKDERDKIKTIINGLSNHYTTLYNYLNHKNKSQNKTNVHETGKMHETDKIVTIDDIDELNNNIDKEYTNGIIKLQKEKDDKDDASRYQPVTIEGYEDVEGKATLQNLPVEIATYTMKDADTPVVVPGFMPLNHIKTITTFIESNKPCVIGLQKMKESDFDKINTLFETINKLDIEYVQHPELDGIQKNPNGLRIIFDQAIFGKFNFSKIYNNNVLIVRTGHNYIFINMFLPDGHSDSEISVKNTIEDSFDKFVNEITNNKKFTMTIIPEKIFIMGNFKDAIKEITLGENTLTYNGDSSSTNKVFGKLPESDLINNTDLVHASFLRPISFVEKQEQIQGGKKSNKRITKKIKRSKKSKKIYKSISKINRNTKTNTRRKTRK